jgi:sugar O-acyltransferase (sialic acid O-acetyltransferase NeuD family)
VLLTGSGVYAAGGANDGFAAVAAAAATQSVPLSVPTAESATVADDRTPEPERHRAGGPARLPLLLIGAGGHARVVLDIVEKQGRYQVVGLLDDSPQLAGGSLMGYPVWGGREGLDRTDLPAHAFVAIGSPAVRTAWQETLEDRGFQLAVLVHPSAQIGRDVVLGAGTVLMAGAIVNSGSRLERGVIVNTAASIDHDCRIGEFVHVAPGARLAGGVHVGPRAHIGIGACVLQNLEVGERAIVGGGAAVVRPVPAHLTVVGVPARPLHAAADAPGAGPNRIAVRT